MSKITVIGSGALGSALGNVLIDSSKLNEVLIYGIDQNELNDLEKGINTKYFGDAKFNSFKTTSNLNEALKKCDYVVLAIPSIVIDKIIDQIINIVDHPILIINGCKGFYPNTEKPLHSGICEKTKSCKNIKGVVSILGPSFAIEIINKALTSISAIGHDEDQIKEVQSLLNTSYFKLYGQSDVIGAEVGGIYKNILAIGAGMMNALGFTINTIASYLTRGMSEMSRFNKFMGGKDKTIYGLTGLGDLILTATDLKSRNFTYGYNFAKKNISDSSKITLEGLTALNIVEKIRIKNNLYLPIAAALYNVIHNNSSFEIEIKRLWESELKGEN